MQLEGTHVNNDMWKSIKEVNTRLKRFASKHHHVLFYNADDIFVETRSRNMYIPKALYVDKVHPSLAGYKELVNSQLDFLDSVMEKRANSKENSSTTSTSQTGSKPESNSSPSSSYSYEDNRDEFTDDYYGYIHQFDVDDDLFSDYNIYDFDDLYDTDDDWW